MKTKCDCYGNWYLLYGGESCDGAGAGKYESRTTSKKVALEFFKMIKKNPYSTGKVVIIDDAGMRTAWDENSFK